MMQSMTHGTGRKNNDAINVNTFHKPPISLVMRYHGLKMDSLLLFLIGVSSFATPACFAFLAPTRRQGTKPATIRHERVRLGDPQISQSHPDGTKEQSVRDEIAQRNSMISDEAKYAVVDGSDLEKLDLLETSLSSAVMASAATNTTATPLSDRDELLALSAKTRAYPLFLLEKSAEVLEGFVSGFGLGGFMEEVDGSAAKKGAKERIVLLGTGWGGVSLLQEIDCSKFDVTVISPRNHFVFTPMVRHERHHHGHNIWVYTVCLSVSPTQTIY
jgi:hypothetical protein